MVSRRARTAGEGTAPSRMTRMLVGRPIGVAACAPTVGAGAALFSGDASTATAVGRPARAGSAACEASTLAVGVSKLPHVASETNELAPLVPNVRPAPRARSAASSERAAVAPAEERPLRLPDG